MSERRVVITGIGALSAFGEGREVFWDAVSSGCCGIGPLDLPDSPVMRFRNAAQVRGFNPEAHFEAKRAGFLDKFAQFALVAAREAVRDSGLEFDAALRDNAAIVTGSCLGGQTSEDAGFYQLYRLNNNRVQPLLIPLIMANAGASAISMEYGITGPVYTISTACSSSNHAIGQAFWMVRSGQVDAAITGGSEAPFSTGNLKAWEALRVVSPRDVPAVFARPPRG